MSKISEALTFGLTIRESADDGSDFTNPAADYRRLFLGEDGLLHLKDSAGAVTDIGGTSGGLTHAYAGYNTVGGTAEDCITARTIAKQVTLAADGLIASIGVYLQADTGPDTFGISVGVWDDNTNTVGKLLAINAPYGPGSSGSTGAYAAMVATTPRWITVPVGLWAAAGTYWIGFIGFARGFGGNRLQCYRDTSGSDRRFDASGEFTQDGGVAAQTDTTYKYSIRASVLS